MISAHGRFVLAGLLAFMVLGFTRLRADEPDDLRAAIEAANKRLASAFAKGDAAAVASSYTEDGQLFPPNQDVIQGTKAIDAFYRAAIATGAKGLTLESVEVGGGGDWAIETGKYKILGAEGKAIESGKYLVVWKRVDGAWKLHRDIWNTNS